MRFALFAAIAATALLGASCSVQDFGTKVMDKTAITASFDVEALVEAATYDLDAVNLWFPFNVWRNWNITDSRNAFAPHIALNEEVVASGNYSEPVNSAYLTFTTPATISSFRLWTSGASRDNTMYIAYGNPFNLLPSTEYTFVFDVVSVDAQYVSGIEVRNFALFEGGYHSYVPYNYQTFYNDGYYDAERDNGIFNHAYYVTGNDGTNTVTNFIDASLLEWYASANTQGLFDPYALVSFLGLSSSATSYTITIQYGEFAPGANFPLAAYPLYVDVLSDGEVQDPTLCPSLSISTYRGGSIRGNNLFDADFNTTYAGLAVGYPNPAIYNKQYDTFNRISLYLPKNQAYSDMRQIGVVSPYAQGFVDGVTSRDGEVQNLTDRILGLEDNLSQYNGMTYTQIYELGRQAGISAGNAANSMMSGLFGAVLSVPLSIFGGLSEFSVLGVSVMSLIISLLVVAVAVMVLKRFL